MKNKKTIKNATRDRKNGRRGVGEGGGGGGRLRKVVEKDNDRELQANREKDM